MLSDNNLSRACRRIREHIASIVPAMMQRNAQPSPTIVLATEDFKHTLSVADSLRPAKKHYRLKKKKTNKIYLKLLSARAKTCSL